MQPADPLATTPGAPRLKILVVDDEVVSRTIITKLLVKHTRAEVREARAAEEAFQLLEQGLLPDLIISDVLMPGLSGEEFLSRLRTDPRWQSLRVLICSSANNRQTVERLARLGVAGYLLKPIASKRLLEEIRKVEKTGPAAGVLEPLEAVLARLGLAEADYRELLDLFLDESGPLLADLQAAAAAGEHDRLRQFLHSLHGSASNLGAQLLAQASERALTELKDAAAATAGRLIEPVLFEARRLTNMLRPVGN